MSYPCHIMSFFQKGYIWIYLVYPKQNMASRAGKKEQIPLFFPLRPSGPAAGTSPLLTSKVLLFILRQLGIISWRPSRALGSRVRPGGTQPSGHARTRRYSSCHCRHCRPRRRSDGLAARPAPTPGAVGLAAARAPLGSRPSGSGPAGPWLAKSDH